MEHLAFDGGLFFWTLLTFGCLFLVLARFTFKPLRRLLQQREDAIQASLDKAEESRREAERILARNEERLAHARDEARRIINEGHKVVADMKREAGEKARQDADLLVQQARTDIDIERRRSLDELKSTVANLSVRIARQVIKAELDEQQHARLADTFIERLKKTHATRQS